MTVSATAPAKGTKTWLKRNLTKFPISSDFFSFVMQVLLLYIDYQKYLIVHLKRTNCDEQRDQIFHFYDISKCISTIWWDSSLSNKSDHPLSYNIFDKRLDVAKKNVKTKLTSFSLDKMLKFCIGNVWGLMRTSHLKQYIVSISMMHLDSVKLSRFQMHVANKLSSIDFWLRFICG